MPIQSPFEGGATLNQPTHISKEELLHHYLHLSLPQFTQIDFIYLACAALRHIISYIQVRHFEMQANYRQ